MQLLRKITKFLIALEIPYRVYCLLGQALLNAELEEPISLSPGPDPAASRSELHLQSAFKARMVSNQINLSSDPRVPDC